MMRVAYISGAYSAATIRGVVKNIRAVEEVAIAWWHHGYAVIAPHLNTALLDGAVDYETIMEGDLELVRRSDVLVMMPRWKSSAGAVREHELALQLGKEIRYL